MSATFLQTVLMNTAAYAAARRMPWYVVGGVVRDALLNRARAFPNVDLAIPSGALAAATSLARELGGTFICLDEAAGSARIVVGDGAQRVELDLSDFRGATIEEDLSRRDFTINATLLEDGYATTLTIPPNVRYAERFRTLAAQARRDDRGLWRGR